MIPKLVTGSLSEHAKLVRSGKQRGVKYEIYYDPYPSEPARAVSYKRHGARHSYQLKYPYSTVVYTPYGVEGSGGFEPEEVNRSRTLETAVTNADNYIKWIWRDYTWGHVGRRGTTRSGRKYFIPPSEPREMPKANPLNNEPLSVKFPAGQVAGYLSLALELYAPANSYQYGGSTGSTVTLTRRYWREVISFLDDAFRQSNVEIEPEERLEIQAQLDTIHHQMPPSENPLALSSPEKIGVGVALVAGVAALIYYVTRPTTS